MRSKQGHSTQVTTGPHEPESGASDGQLSLVVNVGDLCSIKRSPACREPQAAWCCLHVHMHVQTEVSRCFQHQRSYTAHSLLLRTEAGATAC